MVQLFFLTLSHQLVFFESKKVLYLDLEQRLRTNGRWENASSGKNSLVVDCECCTVAIHTVTLKAPCSAVPFLGFRVERG